ncbi:MAG: GatB/YqeY domain-containing protein [Bdellovibrionota bacterium]
MSGIKAKLQEDVKSAMKARDQERLNTLRMLTSAIKQIEVDTRTELDDASVLTILQKEVKKRRDALQFAEEAKRDDLIAQNKSEIALIQQYMGDQLNEAKLKELIGGYISGGADNLGKIMGELNKSHKGKFDGKVASELAKTLLAG